MCKNNVFGQGKLVDIYSYNNLLLNSLLHIKIYKLQKLYFMKSVYIFILCCIPVLYSGCSKDSSGGGGGLNIFSVQDDIDLGRQVKAEIFADPAQFPIINPNSNPDAYNYLLEIRNDILNTGTVTYDDRFDWEIYIIKRDDVLNAFCTPGGYIYVYTGLIKYLDTRSALAGVIGHEMAHADKRHSTEQLTKIYGIQTLLSVLLGDDPGLLAQIATQLVALDFSRDNEREADAASVDYLCSTKYRSDGAADFFAKLIEEGNSSNPPEFLSTHPNPDNRVSDIRTDAEQQGCTNSISQQEDVSGYQSFKASL